MPELESITIRGFKSIASVEGLKLNAVNVVIGPNGSGKSNFIGVFAFLHAIREGHLQEYVARAGGADRLLHFGSKVTQYIDIAISFQGDVNGYYIRLAPTATDQLVPVLESAYFWNKQQYSKPWNTALAPIGTEAGISDPRSEKDKVPKFVRGHLTRWRLYHFHDTSSSSPMKATCDVGDNRFLRPDGSNLAAFLFLLKIVHSDCYQKIRAVIQTVTPFFDDFVLEPQKLNPNKIRLEWRHKGSESYFDSSSFSDGSLRFIALATLFLQPRQYRPSVILVDEPELGLHPFAIGVLASMVKQISVETQVILSTQSPLLLDHFDPQDVLIADRVNGSTALNRLSPDKLSDWLEEYSLGQLWEKNELGGRPRTE